MKTNALLSVFSGVLLALTGLEVGATAQIQVLAPYWAHDLEAGTYMAELRTLRGVTYRNVRIQAINAQQMQFSHSQGVNVEWLTNIVDPNRYLQRGMDVPSQQRGGGGGGGGGAGNTVVVVPVPAEEPDTTVGVNGPVAQLMEPTLQVTTGILKLTHRQQNALIAWAKSDGSRGTGGLGLDKLTEYERVKLMEWLSARVAAARGQ